jgi:hypothetical protein
VENDDSDLECCHVLLKAQVAITGQEYVEFLFSLGKQRAVFEAGPTQFLGRDSIVSGESAGESPVEALVNQYAHRSEGFEHCEFAGFDHSDDLLAFDGAEGIEEVVDGFTAFEIVDEILQRNACSNKDRCASHNLTVGVHHTLQIFDLHAM